MKADPKKTLVSQFRDLAVGDSIDIPHQQAASARSIASNYGFQWNRKFRSKTFRNDRFIRFTRIY